MRTITAAAAILAVFGAAIEIGTVAHARSGESSADARAAQQTVLAASGQLAVQSETYRSTDLITAALLAVASWRIDRYNPAALESLLKVYAQPEHETLDAKDLSVNDVAFSPNGKIIAIAGLDGTVRLWNASTRAQIGAAIAVPSSDINGVGGDRVAFSPDGKILATAGSDGTVRLWNASTHSQIGAPIAVPGNSVCSIEGVAFSPNGETVVPTTGRRVLRT